MTDQQDKDGRKKERRKVDKSVIKTPNYTGPDRRKSPRRIIDQANEPRE